MKLFGSIFLAGGFLGGSYISVAQVASVDWTFYGGFAGIMVAGMLMLFSARRAELELAGGKHEADIETLRSSLASLTERVKSLRADESDEAQLGIHGRIDAELMGDIGTFVEARESMIVRLGMNRYAEIMSAFANGERLLNRAWSASADGYVDEVRLCVGQAESEFQSASQLLESATATATA